MTARLIQLSGVIIDLVYKVEQVPAPGTEAVVHGCTLAAGGGFNAMVAARRSGIDVAYGGTLGTGPFADIAANALACEGIAVLRPRRTGMDQGCCTVLIDRNGERSFVAAAGADGVVSDADLALIPVAGGDWFLLSGYALGYAHSRGALTRWLRAAPVGMRLVFDPCPLVASIPETARSAARAAALWITANRAEAQVLTGAADPETACAMLAHARPKEGGAIVRDGANGCYMARPGGKVSHVAGHRVQAIDTNGAGDAHTGAFIAMLARQEPPLHAARIANVCAALSTTEEGPSTAPHLQSVMDAMAETTVALQP